uniref:Uncharacterized protein n=1 Tax=Chlamydomonas euryale TaxID=1486919 RepID=A0A7R9V6U2_9CHLO|mmetsp:Transcript_19543/g.57943  ORF Transcript_19543/g.57943 Transcript_19543/m.57943 type:complete len:105 (+) Transcript_19543:142-456(+)
MRCACVLCGMRRATCGLHDQCMLCACVLCNVRVVRRATCGSNDLCMDCAAAIPAGSSPGCPACARSERVRVRRNLRQGKQLGPTGRQWTQPQEVLLWGQHNRDV